MELLLKKKPLFDKSSLIYTYKWDSNVSRNSRLKKTLDRTRGEEVLHFLNEFFRSHSLSSANSFKKAEHLLYNHLPINIKNKTEVTSWLLKHWDRDFYY